MRAAKCIAILPNMETFAPGITSSAELIYTRSKISAQLHCPGDLSDCKGLAKITGSDLVCIFFGIIEKSAESIPNWTWIQATGCSCLSGPDCNQILQENLETRA